MGEGWLLMRKTYHAYILIAPLMAGCVLFYIVPFALILRHSFLRGSGRSAPSSSRRALNPFPNP